MKKIEKTLTTFMNKLADFIGRPLVFVAVLLVVTGWFAARLFLDYDVWFDALDLAIFVSTFFLLFLLQSSQNADTEAMQDKLDEIIDALPRTNKDKEREEKRMKKGEPKQ